jgi:hypothetical protein
MRGEEPHSERGERIAGTPVSQGWLSVQTWVLVVDATTRGMLVVEAVGGCRYRVAHVPLQSRVALATWARGLVVQTLPAGEVLIEDEHGGLHRLTDPALHTACPRHHPGT